VLETTNRCSLACVHCTVAEGPSHPHHARDGFLPLATAEALFADLVAVGARFDTLILFWLGEPLIHPEFGAIYRAALRAASDGGVFTSVEVHTNATHLGRDRVAAALNDAQVPQTWHFTLDATTPATYRAIKGRDELPAVEANLRALLDALAARGARWPRPVFQLILSSRNAREAAAFRDRWTGECRRRGIPVRTAAQRVPPGTDAVVFFRQLDAPTVPEQERENAVFREAVAAMGLPLPTPDATPTRIGGAAGVCGCLWKSPVVSWDGQVTTCTRDNRLGNRLGSLHEHPFSALWWGERMVGHRRTVASGDYTGLPACTGCFIPRSANYTGIDAAELAACG
jgi:hypothetical protein